ncbi:hypothetical protein FHW71_003831 [Enterobacter sp. Sphag1F]|jgi:hypothetical protein|nr:hypothetical protein [Enterobacter sp. Sphag1F]NYI16152.1 hypothetical protein [Enterobacter sp. Sphag71]
MSSFPYYIAILLIICVTFISFSLMLDLFEMREWMHHTTHFLETTLKDSDTP